MEPHRQQVVRAWMTAISAGRPVTRGEVPAMREAMCQRRAGRPAGSARAVRSRRRWEKMLAIATDPPPTSHVSLTQNNPHSHPRAGNCAKAGVLPHCLALRHAGKPSARAGRGNSGFVTLEPQNCCSRTQPTTMISPRGGSIWLAVHVPVAARGQMP
jgi:hypothetical protein